MGDPKRPRKKYSKPSHPWSAERIAEEKKIMAEYGFGNKKEIWKISSLLRNFKQQAKKLVRTAEITPQLDREKQQMLSRLFSLNLIKENATIDDVLSLSPKNLFERRLQTLVFRNGLARTVKQARQMIVHGHIFVSTKKITSPSYLVRRTEEISILFSPNSHFSDPMHPERQPLDKAQQQKKAVGAA